MQDVPAQPLVRLAPRRRVRRGLSREAFGKPIARLGKNTEVIAKARIEIEAMRLMVLKAAKAMDLILTGRRLEPASAHQDFFHCSGAKEKNLARPPPWGNNRSGPV